MPDPEKADHNAAAPKASHPDHPGAGRRQRLGLGLAGAYYALGLSLLIVYGEQVCPFIETLPLFTWASLLAVSLSCAFALRLGLEAPLVLAAPVAIRSKRQFWLDFLLYASCGLAVGIADMILFGFPFGSGMKVVLGCASLGFFTGLDLSLARERDAVLSGDYASGPFQRMLPFRTLTRKFALAASALALFASGVVMLVMVKDFQLLHDSGSGLDFRGLLRGVGIEIGFVAAILLGLTLRVIWSYSRNLRLLFDLETGVLAGVGLGNLENMVPVVTDDEFGAVAEHTNAMIEGLREKRRIRDVLGKVMDPGVAEKLLAGGEPTLGGTRRELAVLVSDVRGFTTRSEHAAPEQVVADLNLYFTRMVQAVGEHGGVVDKFIGDGLLAVFGLDGEAGACDQAVRAARAMFPALAELNRGLSEPMSIGVGVHFGPAVAGLVGSPERLEFTVIGDTVNTAARLESLTKETGLPVAVSEAVRSRLSPELSQGWTDLGPRRLKGKAASLRVFGWTPGSIAG